MASFWAKWESRWWIYPRLRLWGENWNIPLYAGETANGKRERLQLEINIHAEWCGGCRFHTYPYDAPPPIRIDGKKEIRTFNCDEDVWEIIDLLIEETEEINEKGKEFDIAKSVNAQLPFFCCKNIVQSREHQKDIERYIYSEQFGISPYPGSYGEQPAKWVDKAFIIKNTLAKKQKDQIDATRKDNN